MKKPSDKKQAEWEERFREAEAHAGGVAGYCQEKGIRRERFYWWRRRIRGAGRSVRAKRPFARVEVMPASAPALSGSRMPDPHWLAQFLLALSEGSAR